MDIEFSGDEATKRAQITEFLGGKENIRNAILDELIDGFFEEREMLGDNEPLDRDALKKETLEYEQEQEEHYKELFEKGIKELKEILSAKIRVETASDVMIDTLFDCVSDLGEYSDEVCAKLKHSISAVKDTTVKLSLLMYLTNFEEMENRERKAFRAGFKLCASILQTLPDVNYQRMGLNGLEELRKILTDAVNK